MSALIISTRRRLSEDELAALQAEFGIDPNCVGDGREVSLPKGASQQVQVRLKEFMRNRGLVRHI